jgi:hypothetical protein
MEWANLGTGHHQLLVAHSLCRPPEGWTYLRLWQVKGTNKHNAPTLVAEGRLPPGFPGIRIREYLVVDRFKVAGKLFWL